MPVSDNPIATAAQHRHELLALDYFNHPEVLKTRAEVREFWLNLAQPSAEMRKCFDAAFEEVMFGATIWALNQDPVYPQVITITRLAHQLGDTAIPGSRWGIDNPDSIYRVIPISDDESYLIRGNVAERRLVENYFTLWDENMQTLALLSGRELHVDAQGRFEITVDSSPANGRANHIQTSPGAKEFYIRDVIADWKLDRPNELSVERLGTKPGRPPRSRDENLVRVQAYMHKWAANTTRWNNQAMNRAPNDFSFTIDRDSDGALRNQIYIMGHFILPDDNSAIVLQVNMGGAEYFIAPITNIWGTSNEIMMRNGCLNMAQSRANQDGSYTFVLAKTDPGVHNWLDPGDMLEGILTLRWAEFADDTPQPSLGVRSVVTDLTQLEAHLPAGVQRLDRAQRATQARQREQSYAWRLNDKPVSPAA